MTKKEIVKMLAPWPEEAEVEIELKDILRTGGEPVWANIVDVENWDIVKDSCIGHCLIRAGEIVME